VRAATQDHDSKHDTSAADDSIDVRVSLLHFPCLCEYPKVEWLPCRFACANLPTAAWLAREEVLANFRIHVQLRRALHVPATTPYRDSWIESTLLRGSKAD
jgi:hypothetical protein